MTGNGRVPRRLLHTSDVHLTLPGDKGCRSLEVLVNLAIAAGVDLFIVAGDLFDHNRVADNLVSFVVEQMRRLPMPVVILPGNHDCLAADAVFERANFWQDCPNVRVFRSPDGETIDFPDLGISLWGKSHHSYYYDVLPLAGMPQPEKNGWWHIAVAHGFYIGPGRPLFPSYHITEEEIVKSGRDYIALGHVLNFNCICTEPVVACYSGSPSETGRVAIVDLAEETGVQVTCHLL